MTRKSRSPARTVLPDALLRAAGIDQYPEHVGEGAAVGRLGDEEGLAAQEDHETNADADSGDGVAGDKAHVLLDVGNAAQRDDRSQINAPIKPVKKSPRGFWTPIFNLKLHGRKRLKPV